MGFTLDDYYRDFPIMQGIDVKETAKISNAGKTRWTVHRSLLQLYHAEFCRINNYKYCFVIENPYYCCKVPVPYMDTLRKYLFFSPPCTRHRIPKMHDHYI